MNGTEVTVDPHNEVRKLQELVKKLEKQNEVLRSKTPGTTENSSDDTHIHESGQMNGRVTDNELITNKLRDQQLRLADFEDVDYEELPAAEDSWLYSPTNNHPSTDASEESLTSWIRQDFDHPTPERESCRRALVHFIDEAARTVKHSSSSPVLGSQPLSSKSASILSKSTEDSRSMAPPSSRLASIQKSGIPGSGLRNNFDSNTFTRPKRPATSNLKAPFHGEGDHPNAADIENLAKQQEESLRQSVTPAKNTLRSKHHPLVEGDNGARTSPSRFDAEGSYMTQHRGSFSSDQSTPPDSPHNSQHFQLNANAINVPDSRVRRTLPSGGSGLQYRSHNSSDSSLERHSVDTNGSDEMNLAPEAMRAPSSRLQPPRNNSTSSLPKRGFSGLAPGLAKPQQRGVSPNRQSGLPQARRQIARPSTAPRSSLPQFRRPVTPSSRAAPVQSQDTESSWREGCF